MSASSCRPSRRSCRRTVSARQRTSHFARYSLVGSLVVALGSLCAGLPALVAVRISRRIGLLNTAVFTHLPANLFLILTPFMPTLPLAILFLLLRSALSQMDVPVRTSHLVAVVTPAERAAAAGITAAARSLAAALGPLPAGWLPRRTAFGWPLVIAGTLKGLYDLLLWWQFRAIRPPGEAKPERGETVGQARG